MRRWLTVAFAVALVIVGVVAFRDRLAAAIVSRVVAVATGYDVRFGLLQLGWSHAVARDVHVTKNGDPVLDAERVDVDYALRDIFPGGAHRFGFAAIAIARPVLTLVRHKDGLSLTRGGSSAAPPRSTQTAAEPYFFTLRLRDGTVRLVDVAPLAPDLAYQTIEHVAIDASVKSDARTTVRAEGELVGRRAQGAPVTRWPIRERTTIDRARGIALNHVTAPALPLRGMLGFFLHAPVARFEDGVLRDVDVRAYGVNIPAAGTFPYRFGGSMHLEGGRIGVGPLARPVRDLRGTIDVCDEGICFPELRGDAAGLALRAQGGIFDLLGTPRFRLAFGGDGDLHDLRTLFAFSRSEPVRGGARIEAEIVGSVDHPQIRATIDAPRAAYDRYPFDGLAAQLDVLDGFVTVDRAGARFGGLTAQVGGAIDLRGEQPQFELVATATGPARRLPYAQIVAGDSAIVLDALIGGDPKSGFTARGALRLAGPTTGSGFFAVDRKGVGEFGPFDVARADGGRFTGALRLERPISASAAWLDAHDFRVDPPLLEAALPGVQLGALPPLAGIVDAQLVAGGPPSDFVVAGTARARDALIAGKPIGTASVRLGGTFDHLALEALHVDGPLGRFDGDGVAEGGVFALRGRYDGALAALGALAGQRGFAGSVHGEVVAAIGDGRAVIQTAGADVHDADILGVRGIDRAAGTFALEGRRFDRVRIIAANADLAGIPAVAGAARGGGFLVSAVALPAAALRGTGLPLDAGALTFFGVADLGGRRPAFDGAVLVDGGRAAGRPVSGNADVALRDGTADVRRASVALGRTYGDLAGRIVAIGAGTPRYDLTTRVPVGDVGRLRRDVGLPAQLRTLHGSFDAALHVGGAGGAPVLDGVVHAPEGSYNGLAFRDARARVDVSPATLIARDAQVTVGSTVASGDAQYARGAFAVRARSGAANLADFNDYFDDADVLDGHGVVALAFGSVAGRTTTTGRVDLRGVRVRRLVLGDTRASWSSVGGRVRGEGRIDGPGGDVALSGTILTARGAPLEAFRDARYDVRTTAQRLKLDAFLPALGVTLPLLGTVDADARIRGRYPRLAIDGEASARDAVVAGFAIPRARLRTQTTGNRLAIDAGSADLGFAQLTASGSLGLGARDSLALRAHASAPDLGVALHRLVPSLVLDVAGMTDVDARITGPLLAPSVEAGFAIENGRYASLPVPRVVGSLALADNHLDVRETEVTLQRGSAFVAGSLPLRLQPFGIGPAGAPLSFDLQARGVDLAPFAAFVPGRGTKLTGTLDGRVSVEGTVGSPRLLGSVALSGGSYVSAVETQPVKDVAANVVFAGTSIALQAFHATVGGGALDGRGRLDLPITGAPRTPGYAIALTAKGDRLDFPQYGRGRIDGTLRLRSGTDVPQLTGDVTLSDATIPFAAIYRASGGGGAGAPGGGLPFDLGFDVRATAARNVRVSAPFLDVGATGAVDLTGSLRSPRLAGTFTTTPGGIFTTYNKIFRVERGTVAFDPAAGIVPTIDLSATAHVTNPDPDPTRNLIGSADVTVTVRGPADGFTVAFASDPPYSTDEIVALLADVSLFGPVRFGRGSTAALLPGAPVPTNPLDPPGVIGTLQAATLNFNEEAFSLVNTQLSQRLLAPLERFFGGAFGLTDFQITLDYGGGVGLNVRQRISKREIYLNVGQVLTSPESTKIGIDARPNALTSLIFGFYRESGVPTLITPYGATTSSEVQQIRKLKGFQPLGSRYGVSANLTRRF